MVAAMTRARAMRRRFLVAALGLGAVAPLPACTSSVTQASAPPSAREEIYILHSIREHHEPVTDGCTAARTGFEPFPSDAERFFSFWSVVTEDGRVVDSTAARVAELRGCFGPTSERARQTFYAEVLLGSIAFRGKGECQALLLDTPEPGLFPVRCQLVLEGVPSPYVGGLLTTNTLTSKAPFGADTDPPGYTQASIATIRLWKAR